MSSLPDELDFHGTDRFEVQKRLGSGGMGVVYEAFDRQLGAKVALKTLRDIDGGSLYRFKNEFRALADLQHPNLVRLGELHSDGARWFFTMELIDGKDFLEYVCPDPEGADDSDGTDGHGAVMQPSADTMQQLSDLASHSRVVVRTRRPRFDQTRLRDALSQLCAGVAALHTAGKIHRDIKPSNVLVDRDGRVILLDLGLVADIGRSSTSRGVERPTSDASVVGTASYMAPEQAASRPAGPEADWYSVGVVLYEALTGRPPFVGPPLEILMAKQRSEPPPPSERGQEVPADLDALCVELLRREPAARPSGAQILQRLGVAGESPTSEESGSQSQRPPFVGRARELSVLSRAHADSRGGRTVALLVSGESGVGKSALVQEFLGEIEDGDRAAVVLAGRCYERESVPYKAFDGVVDALARHLGHLPGRDCARLLPKDAAVLARVFPVLRRVPMLERVEESRVQNPHELRGRAFVALRELLQRIAERASLVVYIDDLQWADADSMLLLREVLHPPGAPALLFLGTLRTATEVRAGAAVHPTLSVDAMALPGEVRHLELDRLTPDAARALAALLARAPSSGSLDPTRIAKETGGHPLFIHELVRHLGTVGAGMVSGVGLEEALGARIGRLDESPRQVLDVVAVAGTPVLQRVVARASGQNTADCDRWISLLRVGHFVRTTGVRDTDAIEPYHDRLRDAVLSLLDDPARRALHLRIADTLEEMGAAANDPQSLVRHLESAGETERAAEYAERAAPLAAEALAFDRAAELYGTTLRLGRWGRSESRRLRIAQAEALQNAGRGIEAADAYLLAAEGAPTAIRVDCQRRATEQLMTNGYLERGLDALRTVLDEVGEDLPSQSGALRSLVWQRFKLRLRGFGWKERDEMDIAPGDLARIDIYKIASYGMGMVDPVRAGDFQARALALALKSGEKRRVAQALTSDAIFLGAQSPRQRRLAQRHIDTALKLAGETGDAYLQAWATGADGAVAYLSGRFSHALERLRAAEDQFRTQAGGMAWELVTIRLFLLWSLRHTGAFDELRRRLFEYQRDAERRGDRYAATTLARSCNIAHLAADDLNEAESDLKRMQWTDAEAGLHLQHFYEARALAEIALYRGVRPEASLSERLEDIGRSRLRRVEIVQVEWEFLQARLSLARGDETGNAEAARAARRLAKRGPGYTQVWSTLLQAVLAARGGNREGAVTLFREAAQGAEAAEARHLSAIARRRQGELQAGAAGESLVSRADESLRSLGVQHTERFSRVMLPR
jgi:serine/threonine protein kinase